MDCENVHSLSSKVAGNNMSNLTQLCKTLRATLDSAQNYRAMLQQEILQAKLEGCCENDEFLVLNSVVEAALKENQALQDKLQRLKTKNTVKKDGAVMNQEKVKRLVEHFEQKTSTRLELEDTNGVNEEITALQNKPLESVQQLYEDLQLKLKEADAVKERRDRLKAERDCMCAENAATLKAIKELFEKVSDTEKVHEECSKLEEELNVLRGQNRNMREEFKCLNSKLPHDDMKERRLQLKAEIVRIRDENQAINEQRKELQKKVFNSETVQEELKKLEEELEMLRNQNANLQEDFQRLESKLSQENTEERYVHLQSERDRCCEENTRLRDQIEKMIKSLALESCWKKKSEAIELTKGALESENMQLKEHLWNITVAYDEKKVQYYEYVDKVKKIQDIKTLNANIMQEIEEMQQKNIDVKAKSESYKHIDKSEVDIEAINKKLLKKKLKLEKESQQFKAAEVEVQQIQSDTSELKKQNCSLCKDIVVLEDLISRKGLLKTHLKSLRKEKKSLTRRQNDLKTEIAHLEKGGKKKLVDKYLAENQTHKEELMNLRYMNDQLQSQYEELFAAAYREEPLEFSNENAKNEIEEMTKLNKKHRVDIRQRRKNMRNKASPSEAD